MSKTYIGLDNGVSGGIGILDPEEGASFYPTPTIMQQNYTKTKGNVSRLDFNSFCTILDIHTKDKDCLFIIERPMVNPGRFKATISAVRCLEAQLIALEQRVLPYMYVDSKEWQKGLLPSGIKGSTELKKVSLDIGTRLFPQFEKEIKKQKDADALLIAEYARRKGL